MQPALEVEAAVPAVLHEFPVDAPRNRLEFARWLVSRENPLTARVVVNRHWAAFFGTGIVKTLDDFGMQGESPSHPELLDWLAVSFMNGGWSFKALHRQIVLSATYRQSSDHVSETPVPGIITRVEAELSLPPSRLLARFPRTRLESEIIRDSILHAAGLLSLKAGGPPVRPPQPGGVTESAYGSPTWQASSGEDRYRRSVYTYQKRTAPFAMFATFDAPSGEACVARRDVSNTALQALTLLNDEMFLEAAQKLGATLSSAAESDTQRITLAFDRVLTRQPTDAEALRLLAFVEDQRARMKIEQEAAKAAEDKVATGKATEKETSSETSTEQEPLPEAVAVDENAVETAIWTSVARALFSLDETLTKN